MAKPDLNNPILLKELRYLIEQSKQQVAVVVNSTMTQLYWSIGKRINKEILKKREQNMVSESSYQWHDNYH